MRPSSRCCHRLPLVAASVLMVCLLAAAPLAAARSTPVADAAELGDRERVHALLTRGEDVNAAQGDGFTALHWAAAHGDAELARMLLVAGADLEAATRNGAFTPLLVASRSGQAGVVATLLEAGASPDSATGTGATALMLAAAAGSRDAVGVLLRHGADPDAREQVFGQTALMFAAAANRPRALFELLSSGADSALTSRVRDPVVREQALRLEIFRRQELETARRQAEERIQKEIERRTRRAEERAARESGAAAASATTARRDGDEPASHTDGPGERLPAAPVAEELDPELSGIPPSVVADELAPGAEQERAASASGDHTARAAVADAPKRRRRAERRQRRDDAEGQAEEERPRPLTMGQLVGHEGGLAAIHYAAREGHLEAVRLLLENGADLDAPTAGDHSTPLLIATINGHFDLALYLLEQGADPTIASDAGATPLYAAINVQWAPRAFYPQPSPAQERTTHLELMQALLDAGADPNARLERKLWYTGYNFDQSGVDEAGATAFWRAAQASDVEAMRLLVAAGADPTIPTIVVPERRLPNGRNADGEENAEPPPLGSPAVTPLQVAAGAGWVGNFHRNAPGGMLAAVRYLVEELGADVSAPDAKGYTPLHSAAARGDNEMILYLLFHGAKLHAVARTGETVADMANGPVQRIQPFPETLALLEAMGAKNNHNCVSC